MSTVGSIHKLNDNTFDWRINNYFTKCQEADTRFESPEFNLCESAWYLLLYPNGSTDDNSVGNIGLYLYKGPSDIKIHNITFTIGIKNKFGSKFKSRKIVRTFTGCDVGYGIPDLTKRSILLKNRWLIAPRSILHVSCTIKLNYICDNESFHSMSLTDRIEKEDMDVNKTCNMIIAIDEEDHFSTSKSLHILSDDLKNLFLNEEECDVKIKVKDGEFSAHRLILANRSPVFASMFKHNMIEKSSGVVNIEDCEADAFKQFLCYVYSGKVEELSLDYIYDLYAMASKYVFEELKGICVQFMQERLSVDSFCDIITLAVKHGEKVLVDCATSFFYKNAKDILVTVKWQMFMRENPTEANELYLKLLNK